MIPGGKRMSAWNTKIKMDLTILGDRYYADGSPFWEVMIATREWLDGMEKSGEKLFGSKEEYLINKERLEDIAKTPV